MIHDKYTLYDALTEGFAKKQAEETDPTGKWRGGSAGCITNSGAVLGTDPREAVLRFLGVQMPTDYDTQLMFDAGLTNEDSFCELLEKNGVSFLREEEIPVSYELDNGEKVTGRPDVVLVNEEKAPVMGVELKLICSPFSAADKAAWFKGNVDSKHLIQACHYAAFFDVPWVLAYTSRVLYSFPYYAAKDRKAEEKHMIYPDHRAIRRSDNGKPFMIRPFQSFYDITLADDGDTFLLDGEPTRITKSGIRRFYEYCSECVRNKEIPTKRSGGIDHFGNTNDKNKTLMYDSFKEADTFNGFDAWVESCREITKNS
jgi:hypothetical protein